MQILAEQAVNGTYPRCKMKKYYGYGLVSKHYGWVSGDIEDGAVVYASAAEILCLACARRPSVAVITGTRARLHGAGLGRNCCYYIGTFMVEWVSVRFGPYAKVPLPWRGPLRLAVQRGHRRLANHGFCFRMP